MDIPQHQIIEVCKGFGIKRLSLIGSLARGDEKEDSDVDLIVEFERKGSPLLQYMGARKRFEKMFHRKVDLIERTAIRNQHFLSSVLEDLVVLYEA